MKQARDDAQEKLLLSLVDSVEKREDWVSIARRIDCYDQLRMLRMVDQWPYSRNPLYNQGSSLPSLDSMQNFAQRHLFRNSRESEQFRRNLASALDAIMKEKDGDIYCKGLEQQDFQRYFATHVGTQQNQRVRSQFKEGYFMNAEGTDKCKL